MEVADGALWLFVPTLDVTLHANNRELKPTRLQRAPARGDAAQLRGIFFLLLFFCMIYLLVYFNAGLQHQQVHESSAQSQTRPLKPAASVVEQQECPWRTSSC